MIGEDLLRMLRCPISHGSLTLADATLMERVHAALGRGQLVNLVGETVSGDLDGGLVAEASELLYPIRDEIPCLLVDEAIPLEQLEGDHEEPDSTESADPKG